MSKQNKNSTEKVNRFVMLQKGKEIHSRAKLKSRPRCKMDCRLSSSPVCVEIGHRYLFDKYDNYGFCKNCGDEILT